MLNENIREIIDVALKSKAWPFVCAEGILKRIDYKVPEKGYVLFETGYGPSGLPHIGTFGEVVRTTIIRKAFELISGMPTRLFCVSDDMDGMRKIPDTIPNPGEYKKYMDLPLTSIPDPFGVASSFGHNMNARLRSFLDHFGFEYEFFSATECYKTGVFNKVLLKALECYDEIMDIMLPTLGAERQSTYSPFLPVCQKTGKVLQVPITSRDVKAGTVTYKNLDGETCVNPVTDGHCKLQWKPDFGMRWASFDVDFEMYGKDHLVNGPIYSKICAVLGGKPPYQMFYELFLDEQGQKISKSKGNGLTIDTWLRYAPQESLALFMYMSPQKAKKLYFNVIPKRVDEYLIYLNKYHQEQDLSKKIENPVYHIHSGNPPLIEVKISYSLILNLVSACNTNSKEAILGYVEKLYPGCDIDKLSDEYLMILKMVEGAINYYEDHIKSRKSFKIPSENERVALSALAVALSQIDDKSDGDTIQNHIYRIGKENGFDMKEWFSALYGMLLGASDGPRIGPFIALYGTKATIELINNALAR